MAAYKNWPTPYPTVSSVIKTDTCFLKNMGAHPNPKICMAHYTAKLY